MILLEWIVWRQLLLISFGDNYWFYKICLDGFLSPLKALHILCALLCLISDWNGSIIGACMAQFCGGTFDVY